jgi:hypothetical protein
MLDDSLTIWIITSVFRWLVAKIGKLYYEDFCLLGYISVQTVESQFTEGRNLHNHSSENIISCKFYYVSCLFMFIRLLLHFHARTCIPAQYVPLHVY